MENRKVKQILSGAWHQWEEGGYKEKGSEVNIVEILCAHE
jgi:chitinase